MTPYGSWIVGWTAEDAPEECEGSGLGHSGHMPWSLTCRLHKLAAPRPYSTLSLYGNILLCQQGLQFQRPIIVCSLTPCSGWACGDTTAAELALNMTSLKILLLHPCRTHT